MTKLSVIRRVVAIATFSAATAVVPAVAGLGSVAAHANACVQVGTGGTVPVNVVPGGSCSPTDPSTFAITVCTGAADNPEPAEEQQDANGTYVGVDDPAGLPVEAWVDDPANILTGTPQGELTVAEYGITSDAPHGTNPSPGNPC